ncbi:tryptophan-rich sensory protein [Haladaptatus halobius]|uniref:tryptophan-rich sensory protein n=1 Tax=Haladaptatus halobius TaxID=2884875 RepID=UPI001D0B58D8|nr:TspO/MBR family protein [Haladaptatus halobius]
MVRRPSFSRDDILALLIAIVATVVAFARVERRTAIFLVPYQLWVSFATLPNYELWRLN